MSDIFVSYAKEDRNRVEPLARALASLGWDVFWDRTIPTGKTRPQVIGSKLEAARCIVVVWSRSSINSEWVYEEANVGKKRRILAPVLIDDVEPPFGFAAMQAADLSGWNGAATTPELERLLADIGNIGKLEIHRTRDTTESIPEANPRHSPASRPPETVGSSVGGVAPGGQKSLGDDTTQSLGLLPGRKSPPQAWTQKDRQGGAPSQARC